MILSHELSPEAKDGTQGAHNMSKTTFDYDVAIIGYGPTGVMTANYLGSFGIKTLVLERDKDVYFRARAVTVDGTTLRCMQALGLDEEAKKDMDVTTALRWKTYKGFEFLRWSPADDSPWGHIDSNMIFQPNLERTLRAGVDRYTKNVDIKFGYAFSSLTQDPESVTVKAVSDTGADVEYRVKYVVGADGGSSAVRGGLGIANEGKTKPRTWIVIDSKVKKTWPERELLTFWSDPVRPVVDIPLPGEHHRWEIPLGDDEKKEDFDSPEAVWRLLGAMDVTPDQVDIEHFAFYNHHIRYAQRWRDGRVVLIGDAAHLMPPWAGQGMQSGIRDAANVAWKLRYILQNGVSDRLLDSYQPERQPHVVKVTASSVALGNLIETKAGLPTVMRNFMLPIISKSAGFKKGLKVKPDYDGGFFGVAPTKKVAVGKMVPQPNVTDSVGKESKLDSFLGSDFCVVGINIDPRAVMTDAQQAAWALYAPRYLTILAKGSTATSADQIVDSDGVLVPWFTQYGVKTAVLRPDKYVAATNNTSLDMARIWK